jgi:hypothetical protein
MNETTQGQDQSPMRVSQALAPVQTGSSSLNWTPASLTQRLAGMLVRNPAPDASAPTAPSGVYRVIRIGG